MGTQQDQGGCGQILFILWEIIVTMDKALFHIRDLKSSSFFNEKK
jgi:hypothetical protein